MAILHRADIDNGIAWSCRWHCVRLHLRRVCGPLLLCCVLQARLEAGKAAASGNDASSSSSSRAGGSGTKHCACCNSCSSAAGSGKARASGKACAKGAVLWISHSTTFAAAPGNWRHECPAIVLPNHAVLRTISSCLIDFCVTLAQAASSCLPPLLATENKGGGFPVPPPKSKELAQAAKACADAALSGDTWYISTCWVFTFRQPLSRSLPK